MADRRTYEAIKFTYSDDEIRELGRQLAQETQGVYDLEKKKKELDAELGAAIKAASGRVESLTVKMNNGYEMREVEVLVMLDDPRPGVKRILRLDTNELVREEVMTSDEKQRGFGFEG